MTANEPRFENAKEKRGGNSPQQAAQHENLEILEVCVEIRNQFKSLVDTRNEVIIPVTCINPLTLCNTTVSIRNGKNDDEATTTSPISHAPDETTEDHTGAKSSNKQDRYVVLGVAIGIVEGIDIWAL